MSAKLNMSIGIGTLAVMLVMSIGVLYFTNMGVKQSEHNNADIEHIRAILADFIKDRNVAFNQTFDKIDQIINHTDTLTSSQYSEQAEGKVKSILGNMTAEHEIIFNALNITLEDDETDAETDILKLKEAIELLENRTSQD